MNDRMNLYFIGILPPRELRERVYKLKEEMKVRFRAGHALKSPAHITLQKPFKRLTAGEAKIAEALRFFSMAEHRFTVDLDGFSCFAPRVIYINIIDTEPVVSLHKRVMNMLLTELNFDRVEIMKTVQPHITIATRDLSPEAFNEAWPEFQNREFKGSFDVNSFFLLKHNGMNWDVYREFNFGV